MKRAALVLILILVLVFSVVIVTLFVHLATQTFSTITIKPDGSVEGTSQIQRQGDTYTLKGNLSGSIKVQRSYIVIDGAGYALQGNYNGTHTDSWVIAQGPYQEYDENAPPWTMGIDMANENRHNLTVKNLNIKNFYMGIYIWTSNNTLTGCAVSDNIVGILLSGESNTITNNYIANNENGIFFGVNNPGDAPLNICLIHNSFVNNDVQFSGCSCEDYNTTEPMHIWDDGKEGNFWSDYNGTDADGDGVGDTPYVIDVQNQDRYPLMHIAATPPAPPTKLPIETLVAAIALPIIIVAILITYKRKKKGT